MYARSFLFLRWRLFKTLPATLCPAACGGRVAGFLIRFCFLLLLLPSLLFAYWDTLLTISIPSFSYDYTVTGLRSPYSNNPPVYCNSLFKLAQRSRLPLFVTSNSTVSVLGSTNRVSFSASANFCDDRVVSNLPYSFFHMTMQAPPSSGLPYVNQLSTALYASAEGGTLLGVLQIDSIVLAAPFDKTLGPFVFYYYPERISSTQFALYENDVGSGDIIADLGNKNWGTLSASLSNSSVSGSIHLININPVCPMVLPQNYYYNWSGNQYSRYTLVCPYGYAYTTQPFGLFIDGVRENGVPVNFSVGWGVPAPGWIDGAVNGIAFNSAELDSVNCTPEEQTIIYCAARGFGGGAGGPGGGKNTTGGTGGNGGQPVPANTIPSGDSVGSDDDKYGTEKKETGTWQPDGDNDTPVNNSKNEVVEREERFQTIAPNLPEATGERDRGDIGNEILDKIRDLQKTIGDKIDAVKKTVEDVKDVIEDKFDDLKDWLSSDELPDPVPDLPDPTPTDFEQFIPDTIINIDLDTLFYDTTIIDLPEPDLDSLVFPLDSLLPDTSIIVEKILEEVKLSFAKAMEDIKQSVDTELQPVKDALPSGSGGGGCQCLDFQSFTVDFGIGSATGQNPLYGLVCEQMDFIKVVVILFASFVCVGMTLRLFRS
jgi:hypothetical protein